MNENELPEDIMDFDELRGYIWGWLVRTIVHKKEFKNDEQPVKAITSIDYYFDWFIDKINELETNDE